MLCTTMCMENEPTLYTLHPLMQSTVCFALQFVSTPILYTRIHVTYYSCGPFVASGMNVCILNTFVDKGKRHNYTGKTYLVSCCYYYYFFSDNEKEGLIKKRAFDRTMQSTLTIEYYYVVVPPAQQVGKLYPTCQQCIIFLPLPFLFQKPAAALASAFESLFHSNIIFFFLSFEIFFGKSLNYPC